MNERKLTAFVKKADRLLLEIFTADLQNFNRRKPQQAFEKKVYNNSADCTMLSIDHNQDDGLSANFYRRQVEQFT